MDETAADVRREIEVTRERMSTTLTELERKLNVAEIVRDHPWASLALAPANPAATRSVLWPTNQARFADVPS